MVALEARRRGRIGAFLHRLGVSGLILLLALEPALAQGPLIRADPSQPGQAPSVVPAGNGVPTVNIVAPNSAGLSHNRYLDFNTDAAGAILNNSTAPLATSKLGGLLAGNPNLASTGSARVILNEVTGTSRSMLGGRLEVFGAAADLVVANPNGITCDGCGFVNAPRVTLSTGAPELGADGALKALAVSGGDVTIGANGADLSAQQVFDVVSRQIHVLGPVVGSATGRIDLVAGHNRYSYADGVATPLGSDGAEPAVAIDSSLLGGMYAGRISLLSTDKGSGVNMQAGMASNAGQMSLTSDGRLVLRSASARGGRIAIRSRSSGVEIGGTVYSDTAVGVSAAAEVGLDAGAIVAAAADVALAGATVSLADGAIAAAGLRTDGTVTPEGGTLSVAAHGDVVNHGTILGASSVSFSIDGALENAGSILSNGVYDLSGLTAARSGALRNDAGATIDVASAKLAAASFSNDGTLTVRNGNLVADIGGSLANAGTISISGAADLTVDGAVTNDGTVAVGGDFGIRTAARLVNGGTLSSGGLLEIENTGTGAAGEVVNSASGILSGDAGLLLAAASFDNAGQAGSKGGGIAVALSGDLSNTGLLYAGTSADFRLDGTFRNTAADVVAGSWLRIAGLSGDAAGGLLNSSGRIEAGSDLAIDADTITNRRTEFSIASTTVNAKDSQSFPIPSCDPCDGIYRIQTDTTTTTEYVATDSGAARILAGGNMQLAAVSLDNAESEIAANGDLAIVAGSVTNEGRDVIRTTVTVTDELDWHIRPKHCALGMGHCGHKTTYSWAPKVQSTDTAIVDAVFGTIQAGGTLTADVSGYLSNDAVHGGAAPIGLSDGSSVWPDPGASASPGKLGHEIADLLGRTVLFGTPTAPNAPYLVETRSAFVNPGEFVGSDYFLEQFAGFHPNLDMKRFGDAYAETRLVEDQIYGLTGQRYIDGAVDAVSQMTALYDNALKEQAALDLAPGVALTPDQQKALTSDIVWLEPQTVDGQQVLVPRVYLAGATAADVDLVSARISGNATQIQAASLDNSGTVQAATSVYLGTSGDLRNLGGSLLSGGDLTIDAGGSLANLSGKIAAAGSAAVFASAIANDTGVYRNETADGTYDQAAPTADISAGKDLLLSASGAISSTGGSFSAGGTLDMSAGGPVDLKALALEDKGSVSFSGGHDSRESRTNRMATLSAGGDLFVSSGADLTLAGVQAKAAGSAALSASGDVAIASVRDSERRELQLSYGDGIGSHGSSFDRTASSTVRGSAVSAGGLLTVDAGHDVVVSASALSAGTAGEGGLGIWAGHDIAVASAVDTEEKLSLSSSSGLLASSSSDIRSYDETTVASRLSSSGDVYLSAGGLAAISGSELSAGGALGVTGEGVAVVGAEERHSSSAERKKSGLFVGSGGGFLSVWGSEKRDDRRSSVVNVASGLTAGTDVVVTATGGDVDILGSDVSAGRDLLLSAARDVNVTPGAEERASSSETKKSGFGIGVSTSGGGFSIGVGVKTSDDVTNRSSGTNALSVLSAGRDVGIFAGRDVNLQAADVGAGGNVDIDAARDVNLLAALDTTGYAHMHKELFAGISLDVQSSLVRAGVGLADAAGGLSGPDAGEGLAPAALAALKAKEALDAVAAGAPLASVSLGVGVKSSKSTETASSSNPAVTTIRAGGSVAVVAREGSITGHGVGIAAGVDAFGRPTGGAGDVLLSAGKDIRLTSVEAEGRSESASRSFAASVGVGASIGGSGGGSGGLEASVSASSAKGASTWTRQLNAHVAGTGTVSLFAGKDIDLEGAVVAGHRVVARAGGDLTIASRQDTASYDERALGGSLSVGGGGGSGGVRKDTVTADYANVAEQSGLFAGSGGYDVAVGGAVTLKGGAIASTAEKALNSLVADSLAFSDIENHSPREGEEHRPQPQARRPAGPAGRPAGEGGEFRHDPRHADPRQPDARPPAAGPRQPQHRPLEGRVAGRPLRHRPPEGQAAKRRGAVGTPQPSSTDWTRKRRLRR